jgi:hypothetical protein
MALAKTEDIAYHLTPRMILWSFSSGDYYWATDVDHIYITTAA